MVNEFSRRSMQLPSVFMQVASLLTSGCANACKLQEVERKNSADAAVNVDTLPPDGRTGSAVVRNPINLSSHDYNFDLKMV